MTVTAAGKAEPSRRQPPGLPAPRPLSGLFGALYGAGYLVGGERLLLGLLGRFGPVMRVPVAGFGNLVIVSDPALAKQVFTAPPDVLLGGEGVGPAAVIYGSGSMFVQEEPEHLRRRKLLSPPLHGTALNSYVPVVEKATRAAMACWPVGQPFSMLAAARQLTLDAIVKVIFGVDDPTEVSRLGAPFEKLLDLGVSEQVTMRYALRRFGALRWTRLARINQEIDQVVMPLIAQRRSDPHLEGQLDILALLMCSRDEDGNGLADSQIRDDLITLMLAGHETTATTLAWVMDFLTHHPEVLEQVRSEAEVGESKYTAAVINETLRLRPPVPFTARVTAAPYHLGDFTLDPGTRIVVQINAVNRNPATYENPDEFRPQRFREARPQTYAWLPFGGGIKRCLGASFSLLELTTALQVMLREGEFTADSPKPEYAVRRSVVLVPRHGTMVRFRPRPPASSAGSAAG
ncbi:cytochrome P450 [Mycobacterium sp. NPDC050441]|uniref:cytochrome P450 n=1 Tax=Mycobacterium sp. NPDC050441 TaxID=3155403 RepID=UPI0033ECC112